MTIDFTSSDNIDMQIDTAVVASIRTAEDLRIAADLTADMKDIARNAVSVGRMLYSDRGPSFASLQRDRISRVFQRFDEARLVLSGPIREVMDVLRDSLRDAVVHARRGEN